MFKKIAIASVMLTAVALGQQITPAKATEKPAKPAVTRSEASAPAPALTPAEQQTMTDYDQQLNELLQKMIPLQQKRAQFVQALNAEHPGWQWHDAQRQGESTGFVKAH